MGGSEPPSLEILSIRGPLTDLFEPLLRKRYHQYNLACHVKLVQSYFMRFNFFIISNISNNIIRPW